MQSRRRKRVMTVVGLAALVVAAVALKRPLFEQFWLWKLQSADQATRDSAARRLGEMGSVRAIPPLIELFREISPTTFPSDWVKSGARARRSRRRGVSERPACGTRRRARRTTRSPSRSRAGAAAMAACRSAARSMSPSQVQISPRFPERGASGIQFQRIKNGCFV